MGLNLSQREIRSRSLSLGWVTIRARSYGYLGAAQLVDTVLDEPKAQSTVFDPSTSTYPGIDNFGRVTRSGWERLGGAFYTDFRVAYDRRVA